MVFGYWKRTSVELLTGCLDLDFGPFRPNLFGRWRSAMLKVGDLVKLACVKKRPTEWVLKAYEKGSVFLITYFEEGLYCEATLLEEDRQVIIATSLLEKVG